MSYKLPRSIQVVVFTESGDRREYLLLKRTESHGGFWQSVTGSLEEGESHKQAAVRELREETGIRIPEESLLDLDLVNRFTIAPAWRPKYAPGVTENEEVCFAAKVSMEKIVLDTKEHDAYVWTAYQSAFAMLYWESNKRALVAAGKLEMEETDSGRPSGSRV